MSSTGDDFQVRVRFVTDFDEYRIEDTPFALPASLNRAGLSNVINHLLSLVDDDTTEFDFEIGGRLVRSKLSTFLKKYEVSSEDVVTVKYFPAVGVDTDASKSIDLPSWIGCININRSSNTGFAGCYDGKVKVFQANDLNTITDVACHNEPVRAISQWEKQGHQFFATGSKDSTVKVWKLSQQSETVSCLGSLQKHSNSVESLTCWNKDDAPVLLSGDWNGAIIGWKLVIEESAEVEEESHKRKKRKGDNAALTVMTLTDSNPLFFSKAHAQAVTGILAPTGSDSLGFTSSWDHSIKIWDWSRQDCVSTFNTGKVATSIDILQSASSSSPSLLVSSHVDGKLRIWDARVQESSGGAMMTLGRSTDWIAQAKWRPIQSAAPVVASVNYSGELTLWDLRSSLPISTDEIHDGKALALDWFDGGIVSGGSDCCLKSSAVN
jgi:ribosome biogenesis protein YTM1